MLEAEWPAYSGSSQLLWKKLRNVVMGAAHFRWAARRHAARRLSASTEGGSSLLDPGNRAASRSSLDSHEAVPGDSFMDKFKKVASIVRGSLNGLEQTAVEPTDVTDVGDNNDDQQTDVTEGETEDYKVPDSPSEYRLLSRSESGNDANLIDKLQNRKQCSRSLQFNEEGTGDNGKNSPGKY